MKSKFLLLMLLNSFGWNSSAQTQPEKKEKKKDKQFYVTWGYTRARYSKSTLHFSDHSFKYHDYTGRQSDYDFTIFNATAHDKPDFDQLGDVVNVTIPQYVFRIGYMLNSKWGIELNYDHTKYVVDDYQVVKVKGEIFGTPVDGDSTLNPNTFLHFEHTDGANFWMVNAVRKWTIYSGPKRTSLSLVFKPGAGVVIPRTDVSLFGEHLNNNWHVAGWIVGAEGGIRGEAFRHLFFEFVAKGSYADYRKCLVLGTGNGTASHHFFTGQLTATIGLKFQSSY